ncbi:CpsD/CapB family tyrosine-protein kinase [Nesterenkonia natronophila]|uniref:Tyrosine-protein kinase family protein n=1 Tax=Nesterenkonia natronophila TaxID=2174932 RepID=A0A3A4F9W0_9MICC|nr:CpsD/CapB family tyrosine-protein kinase [Nesterenkonia natronophila]RJN31604.1 tyrosine-protein kinase family protein [Nesterenkonia natronophila]
MKLKKCVTLMRATLDHKLRSRDDLARLNGGTLLGSIPKKSSGQGSSLVSELRLDDPRGEAFRRLWTELRFAQVDDPNPAILVTSAQPKEGKTSTGINLAITAARSGNRVALVDVDLRQPTVASKLGLENSVGLTTVLLGAADLTELFQPWGTDELYVLTAGKMVTNPLGLLDSRAMSTLMNRLNAEFDMVILDGPPVLTAADSLVLAKHVGQLLLVTAVGEVRVNHVEEALRALSAAEVPTGIVLNKVPGSAAESAHQVRHSSWSATLRDVQPTDLQLWDLASTPRAHAWATEYEHLAPPEGLHTATSHVRSQP